MIYNLDHLEQLERAVSRVNELMGFTAKAKAEERQRLIVELANAAPALLATARKHAQMTAIVRDAIKEIRILWADNMKTGGLNSSALRVLNCLSGQLAALVKEP